MLTKPKPRIFLDSNVIFSGLYSSKGAPSVILDQFAEGKLRVVISQQVLDEVVRTIKAKLPEALPALRRLLVNASLEVVKNPSEREVARWAKVIHREDAAILAAAIASHPDCLVTGDKHFFAKGIAEQSGLHIITPAQLLQHIP